MNPQRTPRPFITRRHFLSLAAGLPFAGAAFADKNSRFEQLALDNGAKLIVAYEPGAPLVAMNLFFRVGLLEEGANNGLLALLTRCWISDSDGRNTPLLFRDITELGGNVGTSFGDGGDYTEIWAVSRSERDAVEQLAKTLLTDVIATPRFTHEAVESARADLLRSLTLFRDNLFDDALLALRARAWDQSPYSRSTLGTAETVRSITDTQIRDFYQKYFVPDRTTIVVAGGLPAAEAKRLVQSCLGAGGWGERKTSPIQREVAPEKIPPDYSTRAAILPRPGAAPTTLVMTGFLTPGTRSTTDFPALLLLDALIGGGKGSRLFRNLRDDLALGYEVRSRFQPGRSQGMLAGFVIGKMDDATARTAVQSALQTEMRGVVSRPPTEGEIARAKAWVISRYARSHERLLGRAHAVGWADIMGLGADFEENYVSRVQTVTVETINRVAQSVLGGASASVVTAVGSAVE